MFTRLRRFIESIVYAGMAPTVAPGAPEAGKRGRLRILLDRLIDGRAPSDPLYLTNRTWKQKLRFGLIIGIPCLLLAAVMALGLSHMYAPKTVPRREPTAAEIVAQLPAFEKTVRMTPKEAEVLEIHPDTTGSPKLVGVLRNNTDHAISVEFTVDLWDERESKIDSVTERIERAPAKSSVSFQFPIKDQNAIGANMQGPVRIVD